MRKPLKLQTTYLELSSDEFFEIFDKTMWTVVVVVVVVVGVVVVSNSSSNSSMFGDDGVFCNDEWTGV
jgi:hypothetical protein